VLKGQRTDDNYRESMSTQYYTELHREDTELHREEIFPLCGSLWFSVKQSRVRHLVPASQG